jgi:hypothetical protein
LKTVNQTEKILQRYPACTTHPKSPARNYGINARCLSPMGPFIPFLLAGPAFSGKKISFFSFCFLEMIIE